MNIPLMGIATGMMGGRAAPVVYLLRDEFNTDEASPMATPRTCEPGPGTLTVASGPSISGGIITLSGSAIRVRSNVATTGAAGRACFAKYVSGSGDYGYVGYAVDTFSVFRAAGCNRLFNSVDLGSAMAANTAIFIIWREGGGMIFLRNNRIFWVDNTKNIYTLYPSIFTTYSSGISLSRFGEIDLPSPWNSDATIYTSRSATPGAGDGLVSESNAYIESTWQAITSEVYELSIRRTDDDNRWIVRCNQADSTVKLIQRESGSETERGSAEQTWTNGTSYRIIAVADGTTIRVFVGETYKINYSSAAFNQVATGMKVSHACTNLVAWPRYVTGNLLAELARVDPSVNP